MTRLRVRAFSATLVQVAVVSSPIGGLLISGCQQKGSGPPVLKKDKELTGHQGSVNSVVITDDESIASGGADKTIRVWNFKTGAAKRILEGHTGAVAALSFVAKERRLGPVW